MTVDIIIPNYNGSHLIKKNIKSVLTSLDGYEGKLIIVDDGSFLADEHALYELIENMRKSSVRKIEYIKHSSNKGFSSAVNTGVKASSADFVVLLNTDVVPEENFLETPLKKLRENDRLFAVGCMDKSIENGKTILRGRGVAKWSKGLLQHERGEIDKSDTFWVSGGSSVFRREIYNSLNGMDEIYNPFYWEDIDLSFRAQKAGYEILFDSNSVVTHMHEEGSIKKNFKKDTVTFTAYRNQFIFVWKNITDNKFLLSHILFLPAHFFWALRRGDINFFKGFCLALMKLPAIINKRQKQKKYYRVSDKEIIKNTT